MQDIMPVREDNLQDFLALILHARFLAQFIANLCLKLVRKTVFLYKQECLGGMVQKVVQFPRRRSELVVGGRLGKRNSS